MRFVDLSVPLDDNRDWAPRWARNKVKYQSHRFGRFAIRMLFGLPAKYLRNGLGWANETIHLSTHGTTHVDAPWHFGPECEGRRSPTIDELPLDRFYGPGVVLDISELESTTAASIEDVQRALSKIDHELQPGDIVLIHTGNDKLLGKPAYFSSGPGVSAAATRWILDQGVKLTGIDGWGWDAPLRHQAEEAKRTDRRDLFWEAHFVGLEKEYCHMERLANLDQLPPKGFTVCAFPLKVKGGSAGPARVVALIDD